MDAKHNIITLALHNSNLIFWGTECNQAYIGVLKYYIKNVGCEDVEPDCSSPIIFEDCGKPYGIVLTPITIECATVSNLTVRKKQVICANIYNLRVQSKDNFQVCPTTSNLVVTIKNIEL